MLPFCGVGNCFVEHLVLDQFVTLQFGPHDGRISTFAISFRGGIGHVDPSIFFIIGMQFNIQKTTLAPLINFGSISDFCLFSIKKSD